MSTPDVRVRLSAEGVKEVVAALKTVQAQADRSSRSAAGGLGSIKKIAGELKGLLPAIGLAAVTAGLVGMGRAALASADAMGKLAEKTGSSVEDASALVVAGRLVDVSQQQVQTALAKTAIAVGELQAGSKTAARSFAQLGLSAKDFVGRDTGQAIELLSQRIAAIEDPFRRAEAAASIFGSKLAADLMPLINELADRGLVNLRTQAEELGLLIDGDLAAAADAAGDSFDLMKLQAEGLATSFIAGFAPSIVSAMGDFSQATKGDGVESMKRFGAETGRVLRTVIATFRTFFGIVSGIFTGIGNQIGGLAATIGALSRGDFSEAVRIWRDAGAQGRADFEAFKDRFKRDLANIADQATSDPVVIPIKGAVDKAQLSAEVRAAMAAADRAAAAGGGSDTEARRSAAEAKRLADERLRAEESAGQVRLDLEQRLLELTGRQREAKISALDEELAKRREILAASGGGVTAVDEGRFSRIRTAEVARIDFEDSYQKAQQQFEELRITRERIQQDVELGLATQQEGQVQLAEIELARLPIMQQLAAAALTAAQASGDPALIAQAEELNVKLGQVAVSVDRGAEALKRFKEGATDAAQSELTNFLSEGVVSAESFADSMKGLADSVIKSLQRIAAEIVAQQIIGGLTGLFGGFGGGNMSGLSPITVTAQRLAGGGIVDGSAGGVLHGPGTGTSDSIPAITPSGRIVGLSSGEGIIKASAMRRPGVVDLLRALNGHMPTFRPPAMQSRFAEGGVVTDGVNVGGMTVIQEFNITSPTGKIDRTSQQQVGAAAARGLATASRRNN